MRYFIWSFVFSLVLVSGCSSLTAKDKTIGWSAQKLYTEATEQLQSKNYEKAVDLYQKLESRYPFGRYAMQAQLNVAYAYYRMEEPESALAAISRFEKLHPDHPALAYALYLRGLVKFTQNMGFFSRFLPTDASQRGPGSTSEAYNDFAELVRRFPDTEYARDDRLRMLYLRNNLARHEIHVARYYMDRGAYLAAANRAQYVIEKYQYTPSVEDALAVLIISYDKLGMTELYQDAVRVLALNEQKGNFIPEDVDDKSLTEKIWEYLELDKN